MTSLYDEFRVALHSVWSRRWLVLGVAWGICILGWLVIAAIPNRYDSRTRLLVDVNQILPDDARSGGLGRSEEHTSELQSLMRISYAVFCLKKKKKCVRQQKPHNFTPKSNNIYTLII